MGGGPVPTRLGDGTLVLAGQPRGRIGVGSQVGLEWIETRPTLAALFILDNGQVLHSQKMEEFL